VVGLVKEVVVEEVVVEEVVVEEVVVEEEVEVTEEGVAVEVEVAVTLLSEEAQKLSITALSVIIWSASWQTA